MTTTRRAPASGGRAAELFEDVTAELVGEPGVALGSGFGAVPGLRVRRKIFAMLCRGELVVKLARTRVDELVASGTAERFDARRDGRLMKEWATIPVAHGAQWGGVAREALDFVGGSSSDRT